MSDRGQIMTLGKPHFRLTLAPSLLTAHLCRVILLKAMGREVKAFTAKNLETKTLQSSILSRAFYPWLIVRVRVEWVFYVIYNVH